MLRSGQSRTSKAAEFILVILSARPAWAAPKYYLTEIVSPAHEGIFPSGVNAQGNATGFYYQDDLVAHSTNVIGFFYDGTSVADLGVSHASAGNAINDVGDIVGGSAGQAFIWSHNMTKFLGTLGGAESVATAINDLGVVVGFSNDTSGKQQPFVYSGNQMTPLELLNGFDSGAAYGINDLGQIVGAAFGSNSQAHAVVWNGGHVTDLGTLGGATAGAHAINNNGDIVGSASPQTMPPIIPTSHGVLLHNGQLQALAADRADDINDRGEIIAEDKFIDANGQSYRLNDLVVNASNWAPLIGTSINNVGQIVGYEGFTDAGKARGFILTPVPEPAGIVLVLSGVVATVALGPRISSVKVIARLGRRAGGYH